MGLRDVLVFVDDSQDWRAQIALACDLASRHTCCLTAAYSPHWSRAQLAKHKAAEIGLASAQDIARLDREIVFSMNAAVDIVRAELEAYGQKAGLPVKFRRLDAPVSVTLPQEARCADLCILRHPLPDDAESTTYTLAEKLLFTAGGPILSIPPNQPSGTLGRNIVVAWNSSRASARSLHDAMPLIEAAERVTVITVNPSECLTRPGAPRIERLLEHLRLHGVEAELAMIEGVDPGAVAATLQAKANEVGADLLVAGAFGHVRLWERLLGRATHDLLDQIKLPLLMSS